MTSKYKILLDILEIINRTKTATLQMMFLHAWCNCNNRLGTINLVTLAEFYVYIMPVQMKRIRIQVIHSAYKQEMYQRRMMLLGSIICL